MREREREKLRWRDGKNESFPVGLLSVILCVGECQGRGLARWNFFAYSQDIRLECCGERSLVEDVSSPLTSQSVRGDGGGSGSGSNGDSGGDCGEDIHINKKSFIPSRPASNGI